MTDRDTTLQEAIGFAMETLRDDLVLHMMDYLKGEGFTETDSLRPKCRDSTRSEWEGWVRVTGENGLAPPFWTRPDVPYVGVRSNGLQQLRLDLADIQSKF